MHVGQKVHFYAPQPLPLACLAAPSFDVEAEAPWLISAHTRLGQQGEQIPDVVKKAGICRRVGTGRPANGGLIDFDDLVQKFDARNFVMRSGISKSVIKFAGKRLEQDVVHERRFA